MNIDNNYYNNNNRIIKTPQIESDNNNDTMVQIPGIFELTGKNSIPPSLFLLVGLAGTGKTMYCRQLFIEGMLHSDYCIYVSPSMTEKKFRALFPMLEAARPNKTSKFINPYLRMDTNNISNNSISSGSSSTDDLDRLKLTLREIHETLVRQKRENDQDENHPHRSESDESNNSSSLSHMSSPQQSSSLYGKSKSILVVVDSLTQLVVLFGESAVLKFVGEISLLLKEFDATAIFTLTANITSPNS
jgi:archaellum biogenesis ATPase FlaH